ncbi:MAG: isopentenyl phosphate kinase [Anaerolineae bacterium]
MTLVFFKLGGSLITDKLQPGLVRREALELAAQELAEVYTSTPDLEIVLGHGSGSFGHVPAEQYGTRQGVSTPEQWHGFAKVATAAARLNQVVLEALAAAGLPVLSIRPSSSAVCSGGEIMRMAVGPVRAALDHRLVPLVHGDVAFDMTQGGTIISTEDIFSYLAREFLPKHIFLAGDVDGVFDQNGSLVSRITPQTIDALRPALRGSAATDVTGGMESKVLAMLDLCEEIPGLRVHIFSGLQPGTIRKALLSPDSSLGTIISG